MFVMQIWSKYYSLKDIYITTKNLFLNENNLKNTWYKLWFIQIFCKNIVSNALLQEIFKCKISILIMFNELSLNHNKENILIK